MHKLDSANNHLGADVHPARKLPNLLVGERDTAVGPVEIPVYHGVAASDAVDAQVAAKRRVLGREAMLPHGLEDRLQVRPADDSLGIGAPGNTFGGIIEAVKRAETAAAIDPGNVEDAERRGFVAAAMDLGCAAAADGDILEVRQDLVFFGKDRQGERLGVHQDPGQSSTCPGNRGCPKEGDDEQGDEPPPEDCHELPMKPMPFFTTPTALRLVSGLHILVLLVCGSLLPARGATFLLPTDGGTIVGQLQVVTTDSRNTLLDIARHFDLGFEEITVANPGVSIWLPGEGTRIVVPTMFILPPKPWQGVVLNIPQRRLYYFPRPKANEPATVITFPIGTARTGWPTPLGTTRITGKYKDPAWFVPKSIQEEHRKQGEFDFPEYFPPGPDNPMGMLAIGTGFDKIFIHSTNRPWGVGMRVSHGCIRLYPEDAAELFADLAVGTPVRIINQPVMLGERDGVLYLGVSNPVGEYPEDVDDLLLRAVDAAALYLEAQPIAPEIDWERVREAVAAKRMLPVPVSVGAPSLDDIIASIAPQHHDFEPYGIDANQGLPPER